MSSSTEVSSSRLSKRQDRPRRTWSLRTQLLASHIGLVAVIVLAFGGFLFGIVRWATYQQVEADLLGAAQLLLQDWTRGADSRTIAIAPAYRHRFGAAPRDHAYFAIWDAAGRQVAGSDPLPPHAVPSESPPPTSGPHPYFSRAHGSDLEVIVATPEKGQLLVGRPLAKESDRLTRLLSWTAACVAISVILAAGGAWWLARRISRPIEDLTETAESISSRTLEKRLILPSAALELQRLGSVFNGMLNRLQEAFQRQTRFTADASHELRTPLTVIIAQAEHTLSRPREPIDYCRSLETCLTSARRMKQLIDDLLLLARGDSGRWGLKLEPVDLAEVVHPAVETLRPLAIEKRLHLTAQLQQTPLRGDAARLMQVATNLITNAIQYNVSDGDVFINVYRDQDVALLVVADRGVGISAEHQTRVGERFFRADAARTHGPDSGTGLGLSLVKEIVAAHGGTVSIVSEPGSGTTVTVRIPSGITGT